MTPSLDEMFFDYTFQILNYALEFSSSSGYASLRFTDTVEKAVNLALEIQGISSKPFYRKILEHFKQRRIMSEATTREEFLNELLSLFIEEWKEKPG
jgi:hypothetical protein